MKRLSRLVAAGVSVLVGAVLAVPAVPAGATPPTGYGFDNTAELIVGGGSDTTYTVMVALGDLYARSPGCAVTTATGPDLNKCVTTNPNPETNTLGNYQRDTIAQANPTGSSAGIGNLLGTGDYAGTTGDVNFARSSR